MLIAVVDCGMPKQAKKHGSRKVFGTLLGNTTMYKCKSCYSMKGAAVIKCLKNGKWSGGPPKCVKKSEFLLHHTQNTHTCSAFRQSCLFHIHVHVYEVYSQHCHCSLTHLTEYKQVKLPDPRLKVSNPMPVFCGQKVTVKCPPLHSVVGASKAKVKPFGKLKWQGKEPTCRANKGNTGKKKGASHFRRRKVRHTHLSFCVKYTYKEHYALMQ